MLTNTTDATVVPVVEDNQPTTAAAEYSSPGGGQPRSGDPGLGHPPSEAATEQAHNCPLLVPSKSAWMHSSFVRNGVHMVYKHVDQYYRCHCGPCGGR